MNCSLNEIEINGEVYVKKSAVTPSFEGEIKIVILQRGWVYVGRFEKKESDCKLHNAYNIRSWGTTKGLPELVHGPTGSTKLDKCEGVVEFAYETVIHTITVNQEKWKGLL